MVSDLILGNIGNYWAGKEESRFWWVVDFVVLDFRKVCFF